MDKEKTDIAIFIVTTTGILLLLAVLVINLLLVGRNRRLKHHNEVLEIKSSYEKELMKTQIEVAESTLNDIARDLHDDVGQMLTLSIIQLNNIRASGREVTPDKIAEVHTSVQNTLQSVRSISKTLSNDYISSFGIHESLLRLFERISRQGLMTSFTFPKEILFHSRSNEIFTFRIIQELINNTLKHSGASKLSLKVSNANSMLKIEYSDNGKGIEEDKLKRDHLKKSMGFTNIYKRCELMKGTIQLGSREGQGIHFLLTFPNE